VRENEEHKESGSDSSEAIDPINEGSSESEERKKIVDESTESSAYDSSAFES
jgi:hypothetical protein